MFVLHLFVFFAFAKMLDFTFTTMCAAMVCIAVGWVLLFDGGGEPEDEQTTWYEFEDGTLWWWWGGHHWVYVMHDGPPRWIQQPDWHDRDDVACMRLGVPLEFWVDEAPCRWLSHRQRLRDRRSCRLLQSKLGRHDLTNFLKGFV